MSLDFPNSPAQDEIFQAQNGISYQWDGDKWIVYILPGQAANYWQRDGVGGSLKPLNLGDDLNVNSSGDANVFTVDASNGDTTSQGTISATHFDIESLTDLP